MLAAGFGDCEDLTAWRCAELWLNGVRARPQIKQVRPGLKHAFVEVFVRGQWRKIDPSRKLGMGKKP